MLAIYSNLPPHAVMQWFQHGGASCRSFGFLRIPQGKRTFVHFSWVSLCQAGGSAWTWSSIISDTNPHGTSESRSGPGKRLRIQWAQLPSKPPHSQAWITLFSAQSLPPPILPHHALFHHLFDIPPTWSYLKQRPLMSTAVWRWLSATSSSSHTSCSAFATARNASYHQNTCSSSIIRRCWAWESRGWVGGWVRCGEWIQDPTLVRSRIPVPGSPEHLTWHRSY